jgi:hypothetical protein
MAGGGGRLARREEGAARRAVTEEQRHPASAQGLPVGAAVWQGAKREQPGGL